jgi:hypothetical protein
VVQHKCNSYSTSTVLPESSSLCVVRAVGSSYTMPGGSVHGKRQRGKILLGSHTFLIWAQNRPKKSIVIYPGVRLGNRERVLFRYPP